MPFGFGGHRDPRLPPRSWWQIPWVQRAANLIPGIGPAIGASLQIGSAVHDRHWLRDHPIYGTPGWDPGSPGSGYTGPQNGSPYGTFGSPYGNYGGGFGLNGSGYGSTGGSSYGSGQGFGNGLAQLPGGTDQFGLPTGPVNLSGPGNSGGNLQGGGSNGLGQLGQPPTRNFGSNPLIGLGFVDTPTRDEWLARAGEAYR